MKRTQSQLPSSYVIMVYQFPSVQACKQSTLILGSYIANNNLTHTCSSARNKCTTHVYTHTCMWTCTHMQANMYARKSHNMCTHIHIYAHKTHIHIDKHMHTHTHTHAHTHTHTQACTHKTLMRAHIHHIHTCMRNTQYTCTHTCTCIYIHTCIHKHMCTHRKHIYVVMYTHI